MTMNMKNGILTMLCLAIISTAAAAQEILSGTVTDSRTGETLIGAAVMLEGTLNGTTTSIDGDFTLPVPAGTSTIEVSYIGYTTLRFRISAQSGTFSIGEQEGGLAIQNGNTVEIRLETDINTLSDALVTARKNMESLGTLRSERIESSFALENLGAKEMSLKGLSDVQESVVKITGVSVAGSGQLIVRGLGDRYSTTTLNGLPIASPNPDNKLIPLDIFPASTVSNITVSKVYEASSFADYSGAHIDIGTKAGGQPDFFNISVGTGGLFSTIGKQAFAMDTPSMFATARPDSRAQNLPHADFRAYALENDIFAKTPFIVRNRTALPDINAGIGFGKTFSIGSQQLGITASASLKTSESILRDAFLKTYESSGTMKSRFTRDDYSRDADIAALLNIEQTLRTSDAVALTVFFARNASRTLSVRSGIDYEDRDIFGETQTDHIYKLTDIQLTGHHSFGQWTADWGLSASVTSSDEPDRRQMLFQRGDDGRLRFFTNNMETYRYFGNLGETEYSADAKASYRFRDGSSIRFGISAKDKKRNFATTRFLYDVSGIRDTFAGDTEMDMDAFVGFDALRSALVTMERKQNARDRYDASSLIAAAFVEYDRQFGEKWTLNAGARIESARCTVDYNDDVEDTRRNLDSDSPFVALNLKYNISGARFLRLSLSRTITRPSFVEMAPFLYQESYGGVMLRGNASLRNAYNYNADLRYEWFSEGSSDMFSVTGYFKWLKDPIERIQRYSGGAPEHSFSNAESGIAAGVEAEIRKEIAKDLALSANASYMYTNVTLPEGGVYTNPERGLQGASPYLANADLTYTPSFGEGRSLSLALTYNLQGPRIHSVGLSGLGDVMQMPFHSLNFNASWTFAGHLTVSAGLKNILDSSMRFRQDIPQTSSTVEVEGWKEGRGFSVGIKWNL